MPEIATLAAALIVVRLLSLEPPQPAKATAATTEVISFIFIVITPKRILLFLFAPIERIDLIHNMPLKNQENLNTNLIPTQTVTHHW
jgi:hypothetical protein